MDFFFLPRKVVMNLNTNRINNNSFFWQISFHALWDSETETVTWFQGEHIRMKNLFDKLFFFFLF